MDLEFDLFFTVDGVDLKRSAGVYTFWFISEIHLNTEIRDRNLSPSKAVIFLYLGIYMSLEYIQYISTQ